jgi:glycosyltransferase involved in cell wall biosynthesis
MSLRVVHVITGLNTGGAETMLLRLLTHTDRERFDSLVVSMTDVGPIGERIAALGVPVRALGMQRGVPNPAGVGRLARLLRAVRPDVVQTWMYQADLVGGLAAKAAGGAPVVWGIHSTDLDPAQITRLKRATVRACVAASHVLPTRIACCSESSLVSHAALGYVREKMLVIPNGADPVAFAPDPDARRSVRAELGVAPDTPLVGHVARFDPAKDHRTLVRAAALLLERMPDVAFVLCGDAVTAENRELAGWIDEAGIAPSVHLLGRRSDIPRLTSGVDLATSSSSYGEAWPLAVGEAMACGVPCVVTDIGDSPVIVGDTGLTVPPRDPAALAGAWHRILSLDREERARLGAAARRRIEEHFSLQSAVASYERVYAELAGARDGAPVPAAAVR